MSESLCRPGPDPAPKILLHDSWDNSVDGTPPKTKTASVKRRLSEIWSRLRRGLLRELSRQNIDLVNRWRFGQQFAGFCHQCRGDLAVEMRIATGLVTESVENCKRRRAVLNGKPADRTRFGIYQRQRRFQEFRNFLFFARLGLKGNIQSKLGHRLLPHCC